MDPAHRLRSWRHGTEPHLSDCQHLAAVLLHQRLWHQPGCCRAHVPDSKARRRNLGPSRRRLCRQRQPEMGKIPFMAYPRRNSACRTGDTLLLERVQRIAGIRLHHICRNEHVLHIGQRALWSIELIPYKRHRGDHHPHFYTYVHGQPRRPDREVAPYGDRDLRSYGGRRNSHHRQA